MDDTTMTELANDLRVAMLDERLTKVAEIALEKIGIIGSKPIVTLNRYELIKDIQWVVSEDYKLKVKQFTLKLYNYVIKELEILKEEIKNASRY